MPGDVYFDEWVSYSLILFKFVLYIKVKKWGKLQSHPPLNVKIEVLRNNIPKNKKVFDLTF